MTVIIIREILRWNMILVWILPSELRVMSVTLLVFWDKGWLLLDTESLVSEPLSWSSWTSSWMGTFSRIVFCLPRPTVLQWKHNTNYTRGVMQSLCNRSRNCLLYISKYTMQIFLCTKVQSVALTCWAGSLKSLRRAVKSPPASSAGLHSL